MSAPIGFASFTATERKSVEKVLVRLGLVVILCYLIVARVATGGLP